MTADELRAVDRVRALARYYANRDAIRARRKARYHATKRPVVKTAEQKAAHAKYALARYHKKRDAITAQRRDRHARNPEACRASDRKRYTPEKLRDWHHRNPGKATEYNARRRALAVNAFVEHVSTAFIYERDGGVCGICREPVTREQFSLDHIVPLSRGGVHAATNLQTAHRSCNSRKGARAFVAA